MKRDHYFKDLTKLTKRVSWLPIITNLGSQASLDWMSISSKAFPSITTYVVYEKYSITQDKESMG
jgi:hypothetical protein